MMSIYLLKVNVTKGWSAISNLSKVFVGVGLQQFNEIYTIGRPTPAVIIICCGALYITWITQITIISNCR